MSTDDAQSDRLQKILSQAGIASRRKAEELIREGSVTINGRVAQIGDKAVFGKDAIKVNGKLLLAKPKTVYYAFYKPRGVICAMEDNEGRATISDLLAHMPERVYPIGRMDFNSEGLLLLTNDGAMVEKIQKHQELARVYHVKVKGHPTDEMLDRIKRGAKIEEPSPKFLKPHLVRRADDFANKALIEVVVLGGGAFDVKALFEIKGFLVERVIRHSIGQITTKGLKPGEFRPLEYSQLESVINQTDLTLQRITQKVEKQEEREAEQRARGRTREQLEAKRAVTISFHDPKAKPLRIESRPEEKNTYYRGGPGHGPQSEGARAPRKLEHKPAYPRRDDDRMHRDDDRPRITRPPRDREVTERAPRERVFSGREDRVKSWGDKPGRTSRPTRGTGFREGERPAPRSTGERKTFGASKRPTISRPAKTGARKPAIGRAKSGATRGKPKPKR